MNNHTPASQHQLKSTSQIVEGNELVYDKDDKGITEHIKQIIRKIWSNR